MFADIGGGFYPPLSRLMKLEMDTLEERAKIAKICFPPLPHPPANHYHLHHQMSVLQPDSNLLTQKREMGLCSSTTTYKDDLAHEPTQKKRTLAFLSFSSSKCQGLLHLIFSPLPL